MAQRSDLLQKDTKLTAFTGTYRVEKPLGLAGATGEVFRTVREQDGRLFALKVMHAGLSSDVQKRFTDEMTILQRLRGAEDKFGTRHIPSLTESSNRQEDATQRLFEMLGRRPFMFMNYAEGSEVTKLLRDKGFLPESEAVEIMKQFAEVLYVIHGANFTYTDMKMDNLIWDANKKHLTVIDWNVVAEHRLETDAPRDRLRAAAYLYEMVLGFPLALAKTDLQVADQSYRRAEAFQRLTEGTRAFLLKAFHPDPASRHGKGGPQTACTQEFLQELKRHAARFAMPLDDLIERGESVYRDRLWQQALEDIDVAERRFTLDDLTSERYGHLRIRLEEIRAEMKKLGRSAFLSGHGRYNNALFAEALDDFKKALKDDPYDEEARLYAILAQLGLRLGENHYRQIKPPLEKCVAALLKDQLSVAESALKPLAQHDTARKAPEIRSLQVEIEVRKAVSLGAQLLKEDRFEEAEQYFQNAYQKRDQLLYPELLEENLGDLEKLYGQAERLKGLLADGEAWLEQNKFREAVRAFWEAKTITQGSPQTTQQYEKARDLAVIQELFDAGEFAPALEKCHEAASRYPKETTMERLKTLVFSARCKQLRSLASKAGSRREFHTEKEYLEQLLELIPDDEDTQSRLEKIREELSKGYREALDHLERKLESASTISIGDCDAAIKEAQENELDKHEAGKQFIEGVKNRRAPIVALSARLEALAEDGDVQGQIDLLAETESKNWLLPQGKTPKALRVDLQARRKEYREAIARLERDLEKAPSVVKCEEVIQGAREKGYDKFVEGRQFIEKAQKLREAIVKLDAEYDALEAEGEMQRQIDLLTEAESKNWTLPQKNLKDLRVDLQARQKKYREEIERIEQKLESAPAISFDGCEAAIKEARETGVDKFDEGRQFVEKTKKLRDAITELNAEYGALNAPGETQRLIDLLKEAEVKRWTLPDGDPKDLRTRLQERQAELERLDREIDTGRSVVTCNAVIKQVRKKKYDDFADGRRVIEKAEKMRDDILALSAKRKELARQGDISAQVALLAEAEANKWTLPQGTNPTILRFDLLRWSQKLERLEREFESAPSIAAGKEAIEYVQENGFDKQEEGKKLIKKIEKKLDEIALQTDKLNKLIKRNNVKGQIKLLRKVEAKNWTLEQGHPRDLRLELQNERLEADLETVRSYLRAGETKEALKLCQRLIREPMNEAQRDSLQQYKERAHQLAERYERQDKFKQQLAMIDRHHTQAGLEELKLKLELLTGLRQIQQLQSGFEDPKAKREYETGFKDWFEETQSFLINLRSEAYAFVFQATPKALPICRKIDEAASQLYEALEETKDDRNQWKAWYREFSNLSEWVDKTLPSLHARDFAAVVESIAGLVADENLKQEILQLRSDDEMLQEQSRALDAPAEKSPVAEWLRCYLRQEGDWAKFWQKLGTNVAAAENLLRSHPSTDREYQRMADGLAKVKRAESFIDQQQRAAKVSLRLSMDNTGPSLKSSDSRIDSIVQRLVSPAEREALLAKLAYEKLKTDLQEAEGLSNDLAKFPELKKSACFSSLTDEITELQERKLAKEQECITKYSELLQNIILKELVEKREDYDARLLLESKAKAIIETLRESDWAKDDGFKKYLDNILEQFLKITQREVAQNPDWNRLVELQRLVVERFANDGAADINAYLKYIKDKTDFEDQIDDYKKLYWAVVHKLNDVKAKSPDRLQKLLHIREQYGEFPKLVAEIREAQQEKFRQAKKNEAEKDFAKLVETCRHAQKVENWRELENRLHKIDSELLPPLKQQEYFDMQHEIGNHLILAETLTEQDFKAYLTTNADGKGKHWVEALFWALDKGDAGNFLNRNSSLRSLEACMRELLQKTPVPIASVRAFRWAKYLLYRLDEVERSNMPSASRQTMKNKPQMKW